MIWGFLRLPLIYIKLCTDIYRYDKARHYSPQLISYWSYAYAYALLIVYKELLKDIIIYRLLLSSFEHETPEWKVSSITIISMTVLIFNSPFFILKIIRISLQWYTDISWYHNIYRLWYRFIEYLKNHKNHQHYNTRHSIV